MFCHACPQIGKYPVQALPVQGQPKFLYNARQKVYVSKTTFRKLKLSSAVEKYQFTTSEPKKNIIIVITKLL